MHDERCKVTARRAAGVHVIAGLRVLATLALTWQLGVANGQGYSPEQAPRKMVLPDDLTVEVVAAEPLVRQPVAIEFDDAGRLWVIQYLQYPNPAGLTRAKVDRYSRTVYDRVPEPPPHGPQGADRLTILLDRDGDGRAETSQDFVTGLNLASGLALGRGGVFVLQVPYLLFYADRNADDVPDGDPEVLLQGFGMEDAHSVANSLTWGPDGWLYGCQGSTVTSNIRGVEFQQGVWRYHPTTHAFELFCEGGGNSWGLDFDQHGNLFYSTNYGGYAMLHGVEGAYYWKQFGKHGALHNPYAYGYFDHVPHKDLHGGHVTVGGIVYQSNLLPSRFRDKYIAADLLGHAVYWHELIPRGSTFSARHEGDLLLANDTWFAPSDVTVGPDGAIYVCDWNDARTAHPDPDAEWDRTNGRIYRIRPKHTELPKPKPLQALTSDELVETLKSSNDWYVRRARRTLAERRDPPATARLAKLVAESSDDHLALEALWALYASGGVTESLVPQLLTHRNADVRWWTVRFMGDSKRVEPAVAGQLAAMATGDPSVAVRSQLASTAKRLPAAQALPIIRALTAHDEDAADPYLPLLIWWAVERQAISARDQVVAMFVDPEIQQLPIACQTISPRLVRRYAAEGSQPGYLACAKLIAAAGEQARADLLAALETGLSDRTSVRGGTAGTLYAKQAIDETGSRASPATVVALPAEVTRIIDDAWRDDTVDMNVVRLAARSGRPQALARALALAGDSQVPLPLRISAVQVLAHFATPSSVESLMRLLDQVPPQPLASAVLEALGEFDDERIPQMLLAKYEDLNPLLRSRVVDVLLSRQQSAAALLAAIDAGRLRAADIAVDQLRPVALYHDDALDALVKKHWGAIQGGTPEERLAEMRRINNDLRSLRAGDPVAGKALFTRHCGTCHRLFGEGNQIGPELTHANRQKVDELLATIVNPGAVIRKEFMSYVVQTTDGRVLTGLIADQTPANVTLLGAKNERTTIDRDKIESITESSTSLMPDNLLKELRSTEVQDLFSYLMRDQPLGN